jgi:hypothetical protein
MPNNNPTMSDWDVTMSFPDQMTTETVRAAYHQFADSPVFIEFKDDRHAQVYTVSASHVVSIRRR